jgi:hypothetical protein
MKEVAYMKILKLFLALLKEMPFICKESLEIHRGPLK